MQELASEFVPCTHEVDVLFPRNDYLIKTLKNDPGKVLFTDVFGKQVPAKHWNERGTRTKQGIYCMMPDGTYLGARFAGTRVDDIRAMLEGATERWQVIVKDRGLKPKPIPQKEAFSEWRKEETKKGLLLELIYRDLPRDAQKDGQGRTIGESWNRAWLEFSKEDEKKLRAEGKDWEEVDESMVKRLAREGLKDLVYGQSPQWKDEAIKKASLRMKQTKVSGGRIVVAYEGEFEMVDEGHSFAPRLVGEAVWDGQRLVSLKWMAAGPRSGGTTYNFREGDLNEAPLGVAILVEDFN